MTSDRDVILIVGNPVDGLRFYGPFNEGADAVEFAQQIDWPDADWWTADIIDPKEVPT